MYTYVITSIDIYIYIYQFSMSYVDVICRCHMSMSYVDIIYVLRGLTFTTARLLVVDPLVV